MSRRTFIDWIVGFWWVFPLATVLVAHATIFACLMGRMGLMGLMGSDNHIAH